MSPNVNTMLMGADLASVLFLFKAKFPRTRALVGLCQRRYSRPVAGYVRDGRHG
jgi:hypothetical protein